MCMTLTAIHSLTAVAGFLQVGFGISNIDLNISLLPWWLWHRTSIIYL